MRARRFFGRSLLGLVAVVAAGRVIARRDGRRPDPAAGEHLGAIRGEVRPVRGAHGSTIHTEWFPGAGGRGTLVFTHGLCMTEAAWHYQKRDLPGYGLSLATWDLPGHGRSDLPPGRRLTRRTATEALGRVVDEYAEGGGIILVGHSLGGILTLNLLIRRADAAAAVRGAVVVSTPMVHFARSVAGRWPGASLEARTLGRLVELVVRNELIDRILARDVGKDDTGRLSYRVTRVGFGDAPSATQVRFARDIIASIPPDVRADAYRAMSGYDVRPHLEAVSVPTLVVIGQKDRLVSPEESRELARRLPSAESREFPGAGHAPFLEAPERFNEVLAAFAHQRLRGEPRGRTT